MITRHVVSVKHALEGFMYGFRTQPNFIIHTFFSALATIASWYFQINATQWALILLTIFTGFSIEFVNTSLETTVDLITDKHHPLAKIAKDTAAAAMLVYAIGAVLVALIIFVPKVIGI